jgi:hypothetical protein
LTNDERAVAAHQRRVPDPDAGNIRDRVGRAGPAVPDRDAEVSCSHQRLLWPHGARSIAGLAVRAYHRLRDP